MLQRTEHPNGVVTYRSRLLRAARVTHAFSTRVGGVSPGPYASLNLGGLTKGEGDANTNVAANFRRLRRALRAERTMRIAVHQVHGSAVVDAPATPLPPDQTPEADAIVSANPQHLLTIRTADCVPVLLATKDGQAVAAAHAGWRGVIAGIVPAAAARLCQLANCHTDNLLAAVGPHISAEHFEVGDDVADQFRTRFAVEVVAPSDKPGKAHVDLGKAIEQQLISLGIVRERIDVTDRCTYRDEEEFFSHRRDVTHRGGQTGRMAAVVRARG